MSKKLTTEIYIERVNKVHNNFYNYRYLNYINNDSNVIIECPRHGIFSQNSKSHSDGHGCKKCGNNQLTNEEFIKKSNNIHNFIYDYSLTIFKKYSEAVIIICKKHGAFEQLPKLHLKKHGCPKCANGCYTKDEVLSKVKFLHNNKYTYNEDFIFDKSLNETIIKIYCTKHGEFTQRLNNHLHQLNGCPHCNESKGENKIEKILKENNIIYERQKTFDGCKNIKKLFFDFYLVDYNICIEYDGEQHFQPIYGIEKLKNLQKNDNIKNIFCKQNNIKLIRIKYDEHIIKIMKNIWKMKK